MWRASLALELGGTAQATLHGMRSSLFAVAAVAMLTVPTVVRADEVRIESRPQAKNVLLVNPGDLLVGVVALEYEHALNRVFGLEFGLAFTVLPSLFNLNQESHVYAFGPEVGFRFHLTQDAPAGLWLGPAITGVYLLPRGNNTLVRQFGYGVTAAIGYNFIFAGGLVFQVGVGGGFNDYGEGLAWSPHLRLGLGGLF